MIPAAAQVAATFSTPLVPAAIAATKRRGHIAVSGRKKLTTNAVTVAQKTASVGHATDPIVTVVATPEPEGPPSRNDASTTARPALVGLPPRSANEKSRKNRPAPEYCRNAP